MVDNIDKGALWGQICRRSIVIKATTDDFSKVLGILKSEYKKYILLQIKTLMFDLKNSLPIPASNIKDLSFKIVNCINLFFKNLDIKDEDVNGTCTLQGRIKKANHIFELHKKEIEGILAQFEMRL